MLRTCIHAQTEPDQTGVPTVLSVLSVYLRIYLSSYLSVCLFVCLCIYLFIYRSIYRPIDPFICTDTVYIGQDMHGFILFSVHVCRLLHGTAATCCKPFLRLCQVYVFCALNRSKEQRLWFAPWTGQGL